MSRTPSTSPPEDPSAWKASRMTTPATQTATEPATLTLAHTHQEGTTLDGTARGDGSGEVLKTRPGMTRWKWSRNIGEAGRWYIPRSRDRQADRYGIDKTAEALRAAGFTVDVTIDNAARATGDVVDDARDRAGERAQRLEARAERRGAESDTHHTAARRIYGGYPMGQPILVGHHSENRHRRDLERAHRHDQRSWEAAAQARYAARRAEAARQAASGREARSTVANRIDKAASDVARDLRTLHGWWNRWGQINVEYRPVDPDSEYGHDLTARIAQNTDVRLYWSEVLAAMPGRDLDLSTIVKGDLIEVGNRGAFVVARVNRKTFSVYSGFNEGHTMTYRKEEVTAHRPTECTSTEAQRDER